MPMRISIRFGLASGTASDLPIRLRVSYDGQRLDLRTGYVCPPSKWDSSTMRMRPGTSNRYGEKASSVNSSLSRMESILTDILARYDIDHATPSPAVLKADFERALGREPRGSGQKPVTTFMDLAMRFLREYPSTTTWSLRTAESYAIAIRRIGGTLLASVSIDAISGDDLFGFISELWADSLENRTVDEYVCKIKTILRWGRKVDIYHGNLPETFTPKLKGVDSKVVNYLEWEEFLTLLDLPISKPSYASIRDAFCFCCVTGLRVSDCDALTWAQVNLSSDHPHISVSTRKTTRPLIIELNRYSRTILERQARDGDPSGLVFSHIVTRTRNRVLQVLAKEAGLSRLVREMSFVGSIVTESLVPVHSAISTHWGRHTFIVRALRLGIPPAVIMSWTGHASMESMKPYIAIADEAKVENMARFNDPTS